MKVSNLQIQNAKPVLDELMVTPLPAWASFKLALAVAAINPVAQAFDASRLQTLERYGVKEGDQFKIENGHYVLTDTKAFVDEMEKLVNAQVELNIEPLPIEALGSLEMSPVKMSLIAWLFAS